MLHCDVTMSAPKKRGAARPWTCKALSFSRGGIYACRALNDLGNVLLFVPIRKHRNCRAGSVDFAVEGEFSNA